jgi:predicted MPP superfamily phosphohydrolase
MTRRQFIRKASKSAGAALGAYVVGRGTYCAGWERYHLRITEWTVPLPMLPPELDGLRIAHLSDIHIGPALREGYLEHALRRLNELRADAIVMTGDLLSVAPDCLPEHLALFSEVAAPRGTYAVLGNHDFFYERSGPVSEFLRKAGWRVLRNDSTPLPGTGGTVSVIGVDDPVTHHDDLGKALAGVPERAVRLLLAHTPDLIEPAASAGVDLMLAGHTHGGQVVLPSIGPPVVPSKYGAKYAWGLFDRDGTRMVVTRGIGMIHPYVRFRCRPEIVSLTLRAGEGHLSAGGPERDLRPQVRRLRDLRRTTAKAPNP